MVFAYRQGKISGLLTFTGIHLEKPALQKLVQRSRSADPSYRPSKPIKPAGR